MAIKKTIKRILLFVFILSIIVILTLLVADKFHSNTLAYLYPRMVNFDVIIWFWIVSILLTTSLIALIVFVTFFNKWSRIKIILAFLLVIVHLYFVAVSVSLPYYDSYTERLDDYLIFDVAIVEIDAAKDVFPEKSEILELQNDDVKVNYFYQFQHPLLAEAEEYHISLIIDFKGNKVIFEDYVARLVQRYEVVDEDNDNVSIILKNETISTNGEHQRVLYAIRIEKNTDTVSYFANCDTDY